MRLSSFTVPNMRAAWWTHRALRSVRADLRANGLDYAPAPAPPPVPEKARRGVLAVLRRQPSTCLERALVLQRWLAEQGTHKDVVVGVTGREDFRAHAWLEGELVEAEFQELTRLGPPPG